MAYITHADLAESPGALELAEVASDEHRAPVRAELLNAVLRGHDTSAWPAEDVAAAQSAVQRIDDAVYLTQPAYEERHDPGADDEIVLDQATLIALLKMYEEEACAAV